MIDSPSVIQAVAIFIALIVMFGLGWLHGRQEEKGVQTDRPERADDLAARKGWQQRRIEIASGFESRN